MKSKPIKHKTTNTFRFVPFAERINAINIRHAALYHIEHANTEHPEENETHFHIAIRKWQGLNLTESFKKFRRDVYGVITVPQLIHKKDHVLDTLETYLHLEDPLCLQPLLEILVSLAKDLREDFYSHFPKFLDILIKFLDTKDAERLEWTLICLAFLFKILKPYLKKDIAAVLKRIIPLLSESRPQYINNFAAESFAFVARDIRDKKKFIQLILNYLQHHEDATAGCGHLIFEILRGVNGKFHSCTETFLPLFFQHLKEEKQYQKILFLLLTQTLTDSLQYISPKEYSIFWDCILKYTEGILSDNDEESNGLEYILRLAGQVIEYHKGKYLTNPPQLLLLLVKIICEQSNENVLSVCAQIAALLLLSPNVSLSQEHAGIIIKVLLPLPFPNILIDFVQNIVEYSQFDIHILPQFLNFVVQSEFEIEAMNTLAKVCMTKAPLSKNGIKLFDWVKYPIDFGKGLPLFMTYLENITNVDNIEQVLINSDKYMNIILCLPHVVKLDVDHCIKLLSQVISKLLSILTNCNIEGVVNSKDVENVSTSKFVRHVLFLLGNTFESAIHISGCRRLKDICDIEHLLPIVLPCTTDPSYLASLNIVDLYLTAYEHENGLTYPFLSLVDSYLKDNIRSPYHSMRLLTTHIYKLFENVKELKKSLPAQDEGTTETLSVFSLCYSVESISPSIQEYRTQLNMLQKMAFNTPQYNMLKDTEFHLYALNYMLGVLYANFKLLWEPVIEFIAGYGNILAVDEFWPVFYKALETSFANARKNNKQLVFNDEISTNYEIINKLYSDYNNITKRPDLFNYRNLILKAMTNFIQVCEAKNRDVVVIFLKFIDEEYRRNDNSNALKTDVEIRGVVDSVLMEDIEDDTVVTKDIEREDPVSGKIVFKTLINIMQVISQFKNPRALHKEPVFWELYMEFLKHKNPSLQKFALDCVLNYKNKSVLPYKNNLYNIVDEKKFKDELTMFKITEDSENVRVEDREHVIPIILRILYGKMTSKLGADKKAGGQTRRSLVMRYLAGCTESELKMFIQMAFSHLDQYLTMGPMDIYSGVVTNLNLKSVTSPGKLHSILNLFDVIREYFGGYMKDELLSYFFKVFYAVCSTASAVLTQDDKVHVSYIKVMKNIRAIALNILRKLFDHFDKYTWSKDELFVIYETLLWPTIPKLHIEGVHNPTVLLKILNTWCSNPRYYVLLITCHSNDITLNPISAIFKLLQAAKTNFTVTNMILDMIEKLLTLTEDEEDKQLTPIESFSTIPIEEKEETSTLNFGSKILVPYIPNILDIMKRRVANSAKANTVNKRDLLILSRITELVSTPEMCDDLLHLLLPILVKKICMNMAEENMEYAVNTISNLLGHSVNPQKYIKNIAILFNKVSPVDVRKLLCKLLTYIAENSTVNKEVLTRAANIMNEMNAFNKRWIEQPDFDRRLDAYKVIYNLSETDNIDIDLAILIVNNCFYCVRTEKDIGLRDSAGLCLKRILPKLLMKYKSNNDGLFLIRDTVLSLISSGIRDSKNDVLRNECIALLGELVRESPEADVVMSDLVPLINKDDREVDFFDNMCHLQMHRRVRALLKFSKVFKKVQKCPTPRMLTNFILPLATMHLCEEQYTDKNTLIDAAIEVVSTCCRLLPWYHYEVILKHYLNKMRHSTDYQKQLTRILIGILDSFHFDFSKVKTIDLPKALVTSMRIVPEKKVEDESIVEASNSEEKSEVPDENDVDEENFDLETGLEVADQEAAMEETVKDVQNVAAFEKITSVSPSVAKRIIKSLTAGLLPQLNRSIGKMTDHDESHKVNRRRMGLERQEEDMLRVPIALALVKLLQRLPGELLNHHLPGIIIKLCSFLKSPLKQVRIAAKDIVKKIIVTVGTGYLKVLLEHLTLLLTRGFQVHVLVSTIHSVLDALKSDFKKGELDISLHYILDVCTNDLFGALSEEKEVEKLHYKTPEAKPSKKSYVTLMIVSQNITDKCLIDLIVPFKDVLQKYHSKKVVLKVQDALTHITTGLVTNKFIEVESLITFLHAIASESIPELILGVPKRVITEQQREKMLRAKPDCFIVPAVPKRHREVQGKNVKLSAKANSHVLVEFSLTILYTILKREKVPKIDCQVFVDPLVPLLVDSLRSDHVKVTTIALKCVASLWTNRIVTPFLQESIKEIVLALFAILHKYATFEISKQNDNYHLVRNAFKAVTVLIRQVKYYTMEEAQLKTLLLYAEGDCQNDERQANSFALLKAILEAKLVSHELHEVMLKISTICVLSESAKAREEARLIFVNYLTNYMPGKRLERHIQFFVSQLNYEMQHGRESSLKFLEMIITKFKAPQLARHSGFLMLSLGATMVNDAAPECRESAAMCIEALLRRYHGQDRNKLFDVVLTIFKDSQPVNFELAAQLCTRFVVVEDAEFKSRLTTVLSIINGKLLLLNNSSIEGRFVKLNVDIDNTAASDEEKQKEKDHSLIQILNLIERIVTHCPTSLNDAKHVNEYDEIAQQCQVLLAYPHTWVRLKAAKILNQLFLHVDPSELSDILNGNKEGDRGFIYYETENAVRSLLLDLCAQYSIGVTKEIADEVTAVIFQIIKLVHSVPNFNLKLKSGTQELEDIENSKLNIRWIIYKLRKAIGAEVAKSPSITNVRSAVFTMWMHLISLFEVDDLRKVVDIMLSPVVRELATGDAMGPASMVKQLASRVGKKLRRKLGDIEYSKLVANAQTRLNIKRAERKKLLLQEKVKNPEKAAKRKLQLKEKKKQSKKVKLEMMKGKRPRPKKRKADDIDLEDQLLE